MSQAKVVVSNDTGPLHLARAVRARTVGIYWLPNLINWGPLTREKHRTAISFHLKCPNCGIVPVSPYPFLPATKHCSHEFSFVEGVSVDEVLKEAKELLY